MFIETAREIIASSVGAKCMTSQLWSYCAPPELGLTCDRSEL